MYYRKDFQKTLVSAVCLVAALGALTSCGSDDSSASVDPTRKTTATAATTVLPSVSGSASQGVPSVVVSPTAPPATGPAETPSALPPDYPGPTAQPRTDKDLKFLDSLKAAGIQYSGTGDLALNTGTYICQAKAAGQNDEQIKIFVLPMVASEAAGTGATINAEDVSNKYIQVASANYC
ncbi:MAG: DUF732 domain-containing protein [Mycobacteriaceae bacterium]